MGLLLAAVLAATLQIRVLDPSGALVSGARVTARAADGEQIHALTDGSGEATLMLVAGRYGIAVEADGFERAAISRVEVGTTPARLDVPLTLARRQEKLDVAAPSDRNRGRSASNVLTEADIAALPDDPDEMED